VKVGKWQPRVALAFTPPRFMHQIKRWAGSSWQDAIERACIILDFREGFFDIHSEGERIKGKTVNINF